MAIIRLNNQSISSVTALPSGVGGKVLQVQSTFVDTSSSISITNSTNGNRVFSAITPLTVNITPSSTSSKIYLMCRMMYELSTQSHGNLMFIFKRDSTEIGVPTSSEQGTNRRYGSMTNLIAYDSVNNDSTPEGTFFFHLDTPSSASQITYSVHAMGIGHTLYLNRMVNNADDISYERGTSEITAMEIAS